MDELQSIIDSIFNRIDKRLHEYNGRFESIDGRLVSMQTKIKHIQSMNKAIVIFAPTKYPTSIQYHNDQMIIINQLSRSIDHDYRLKMIDNRQKQSNNSTIIDDKSKLFHVNVQIKHQTTSQQGIDPDIRKNPGKLNN
jgi:hypothetical protein